MRHVREAAEAAAGEQGGTPGKRRAEELWGEDDAVEERGLEGGADPGAKRQRMEE